MTRALLFIVKVAILVAIAVWLADRPGNVAVEWQGYVIETSVGILILAVIVLMVLAALLYRLWRALVLAPGRVRRSRHAKRRERGYRALTQGMVAVAAGDADSARRHARRADVLLHEPPLTMLLSAQAAQLAGDDQAARRYFEAMLERPETEFLGIRGLLNQSLRRDDPVRSLELVHRARRISPETPWVLSTCFDIEVRQRRWDEALDSLDDAVKARVIDPDTGRRHRAAILMERSREAEGKGDLDEAYRQVHKATRLMPDFAPAVAREARLLARNGREKAALKLVEGAWSRAPHRDLLAAYLALAPEGEDRLARVKRLERLHRQHPGHPESLIALAEAELAAELWGAARSHLMKAEAEAPSRRVYRLLADLEQRGGGDAGAARNWLAKAATAEAEPAWVCADCGAAAELWTATCPGCEAFDTLDWRTPTRAVRLPAAAPATLPALPRTDDGHARPADRQYPVAPAAGGATAL